MNSKIIRLLEAEGCRAFGFADLRVLPEEARRGLDVGIIMGEPCSAQGMRENLEGKPQRFSEDGGATRESLARYKEAVVRFLKEKGYKANTKSYSKGVVTDKTVGTLSGLGWIGRNALLTTRGFGPALRLAVVLTDAPLECGEPIVASQCPADCSACKDICPVNAIKEGLWARGVHRDEFFDVEACKKGRRARKPSCGLCVSVCPFAKKDAIVTG